MKSIKQIALTNIYKEQPENCLTNINSSSNSQKNKFKLNITLLSLVVLFIMSSTNAFATDYTLSNGNWSDATKWSGGVIPPNPVPAGDNVYMNNGIIDVDVTTSSGSFFKINFLHGLTINAGKTLTIEGNFLCQSGVPTEVNGTFMANNVNNGTDNILFNNGSVFNINSGGSLVLQTNGAFNYGGQLNNSGTIDIAAGATLNSGAGGGQHLANSGLIKGHGVITGRIVNSATGTIAPGSSPGCLTTGDLNLANGTLEIEVNGTTACTDYDKVTKSPSFGGLAVPLGGTLDISVNYPGTIGDVITFLDINTSLSGTFASDNVPVGWTLKYNFPNAGEVSIEKTSASSSVISLNPTSTCANATSWNIPIEIDQDATLGAVSFVLDYDESALTFNGFSSTNTDIDGNGLVNDDGDKLTFAWNASSSSGVSYTANTALLSLDFTPNTGGAAASPVFTWSTVVGDCEFADNSAAVIAATFNDVTGSITTPPTSGLSSDATANTICTGQTITFTATGGTSYEFFVDNVSQGAASATATFSSSTLTDGQVVTVTATDANGCSSTSTGITVTVNALPTPTLASDATNDEICAGETITFTAGGLSGNSGNAFDFTNTEPVKIRISGTNTNLPSGNAPRTIQTWIKVQSGMAGGVVLLWGNTIPGQGSGISISSSGQAQHGANGGGTVSGTSDIRDGQWHQITVTFDGSTSKIYVDGVEENSQTSGVSTANTGLFAIGASLNYSGFMHGVIDELRVWNVVKTPTEILSTMNTELVGNEAGLVAYYNFNQGVAGGDNSSITHVTDLTGNANGAIKNAWLNQFTPVSGSTNNFVGGTSGGTYEFFVDNVSQGAASSTNTFSSSTLTNGQVVTVTATNTNGCSATSTGVTVTVNPLPTAGLVSDKTNDEICDGETITFTASGGSSYEFFVDNVSQGAASATNTFASSTLTDGQVVTATVTSTNGCSATSAGITVTVHSAPTPTLASDATNDEICAGETITFTAGGGTSYEFFVDNVSQGAASATATFASSTLTNGQVVTVTVTNTNGCSADATITVTVNALPTPTLTSSDADDEICVDESVTYTASGADEYIFQVDGVTVQAQSATATYTTTSLTNGQVVSVIGVNTTTGCQAVSTTTFTMTVTSCYEYSGSIVYKNTAETAMGNVALTLTEAGGTTYNATTSVTAGSIGTFSFTDLPGGTYTLAYSTGKTHGGINATDAFRVILHTINFAPLSGINEKAADVNADANETATDALLIARRFVGLDNSFVAGDWAFEDQSFTLSGDLTNQKIYSLAYGDVNSSYTPNETESTQPTVFFVDGDNMEINDGDNVTIPVRLLAAANIGAISLSINYPSQDLTINSITLPNGQNVLYNTIGDELRISWADLATLNLTDNDIMFNINATVNDAFAMVNNPMTLNDLSEIADETATPLTMVDLVLPTFSTMSTNTNGLTNDAFNVQHFPNPFRDAATISYNLPMTSDVSIIITNTLGIQVRTLVQATQNAGEQQVRFEANNLPTGMYFYTITVNDGNNQYQITKQMMLIK